MDKHYVQGAGPFYLAARADAKLAAKDSRIAELEREVERLRHALTTISTSGLIGGSILAKRSDDHSCAWCRGVLTPCPTHTARLALEKKP